MYAIFKREFKSYFTSPLGYILLAIFFAFCGLYFMVGNLDAAYSDMSSLFNFIMVWILLCYCPILSMRLMSEDKKQKTDQLLLTAPVSPLQMVLGKYLSALLFYLCTMSITLVYGIIVFSYGNPAPALFWGNFFAAVLVGAALIAICMLISSLTESQAISAFVSFGVILVLVLLQSLVNAVTNPIASRILNAVSVYSHVNEFAYGIFNLASVVYFISVVAVCVFLTVRVVEKRRWS